MTPAAAIMAAPTRKAVILLSHRLTEVVRVRYGELRATLHPEFDVVLVLTAPVGDLGDIEDHVLLEENEIFLPEYGRKSESGSILPGNNELPLLAFFCRRPWYLSIWLIECHVWLPCGGKTLRGSHAIARPEVSVHWYWWTTFAPPDWAQARLAEGRTGYSLFMISRFGLRVIAALEWAYHHGWSGHNEATVTSVALEQELKIEDLNLIGWRALGHRVVRNETFHDHQCAPMDASTFYHPVKNSETERALRALIFPQTGTPENEVKSAAGYFPIVPVLQGVEWEFLREGLLKQARCYGEFGVGASTMLAAEAPVRRMVAVESDPVWIHRLSVHPTMRLRVQDGTVTLLHGDIGKVVDWGYPLARPASGSSYFDAPWARWTDLGEVPDMVFIDGRYRVACALAALRFARAAGASKALKIFFSDFTLERSHYRGLKNMLSLADSRGASRQVRRRRHRLRRAAIDAACGPVRRSAISICPFPPSGVQDEDCNDRRRLCRPRVRRLLCGIRRRRGSGGYRREQDRGAEGRPHPHLRTASR